MFKMGMVYFSTMRGVPQFYYGTEILMNNDEAPGDHGIIRTDFPGGWEGHEANAFTGEGLTDQQKEAQAFTKKLLNWRKNSSPVHQGKLIQFTPEEGIYVYFRMTEDEKVMVILNKNDNEAKLSMARFQECLMGAKRAYDVLGNRDLDISEHLSLEPKSGFILEIK